MKQTFILSVWCNSDRYEDAQGRKIFDSCNGWECGNKYNKTRIYKRTKRKMT